MATIEKGDAAPDFSLTTDDGGEVRLSSLKGRPVVVYFYPKADTPGCTRQAIDFTALAGEFADADVTIVGVSPDPVSKLAKFRTKHELGVMLAADQDRLVAQSYGVWVEKSMYGRTYMGIERSTFLIDAQGLVAQVWNKVKVKEHGEAVLRAARAL